MTELENKILAAQNAYYNNTPIMSDGEFDELWEELKRTQPDSEILQNVGSDHTEGFQKIKHNIVMGSQNKANTAEEMDKFFKPGQTYMAQYKLDGCSVVLNYRNGEFVNAASRGDGEYGDDITNNVKLMRGFINHVGNLFTGSVRGEILLDRADKEKYFPDMKNCRNAASGIMKHLDGKDCDKLTIRVYDAQYLDKDESFCMQSVLQTWLKENGFIVAPWFGIEKRQGEWIINKINEIFSEENLEKMEYDIDGLVIKQEAIDDEDIQNNYRPKTQIALKPARTYAVTKLIDIDWRCSNGTFTPVAKFEPVQLNGTTVTQANLCNVAHLIELGIEIGHEVVVCKAGMIIPKIVKDNTTGKFAPGYEF